MTDVDEFLMGAGGRSAKFEKEGDIVVGLISHTEMRQQSEIGTGRLLTWDDGKPRMQLVVTLEVEGEPVDEDDDGLRRVYVRGQMQKAVADAMRRAGERSLRVGGKLGIKYTATAAPAQRGFNGAKQYTAKYEPPTGIADDDDIPPIDPDDLPF